MTNSTHIPVMMTQAIQALNIRDNLDYVDATFGRGGYSQAILDRANCNLLSIDKDLHVIKHAKQLKSKYKKRFSFINSDFVKLESIIKKKIRPL